MKKLLLILTTLGAIALIGGTVGFLGPPITPQSAKAVCPGGPVQIPGGSYTPDCGGTQCSFTVTLDFFNYYSTPCDYWRGWTSLRYTTYQHGADNECTYPFTGTWAGFDTWSDWDHPGNLDRRCLDVYLPMTVYNRHPGVNGPYLRDDADAEITYYGTYYG